MPPKQRRNFEGDFRRVDVRVPTIVGRRLAWLATTRNTFIIEVLYDAMYPKGAEPFAERIPDITPQRLARPCTPVTTIVHDADHSLIGEAARNRGVSIESLYGGIIVPYAMGEAVTQELITGFEAFIAELRPSVTPETPHF